MAAAIPNARRTASPMVEELLEKSLWDVSTFVLPDGKRRRVSLFREVVLPVSAQVAFLVFVMYLLPNIIPPCWKR